MKNNEVDRIDRGIELIDSVLGIGKVVVFRSSLRQSFLQKIMTVFFAWVVEEQ